MSDPSNPPVSVALVIDDEPDTVTLLKHILIREGFDVAGAANGKEAINKMNEVQPSLILLDMMMPEMDGWQTIDKMQEISDVPIIILSAMNQSDSIIRALQMGADDYVTKPFNQAEVVARIESIAEGWLHRRVVHEKCSDFHHSWN